MQEIELYKQIVINNKIISTQDEIITLQKEYINFLEGLLKEQPLTSGEEQELTNTVSSTPAVRG